MSFFKNIVNSVAGDNAGGLMAVITQLLDRVGGIAGLKDLLSKNGLGEQVSSWIGNGENKDVSGDQLGSALESGGLGDLISQATEKTGMDKGELLSKLSTMLPGVINHLTPKGEAPDSDGGGLDLGSLAGLAGKFLG